MNKYNFNNKNANESGRAYSNMIDYGVVIDLDDPLGMNRVKVRLKGTTNIGGDDSTPVDRIVWAAPLLPKYLQTKPKINEVVLLLYFNMDEKNVDRLYIGPIITQPQNIEGEDILTGLNMYSFGAKSRGLIKPKVETKPQLNGIFPKNDDIAFLGRYNTDIIHKKNELLLRAGIFSESITDPDFKITFNKKNQSYIQLKNNVSIDNNSTGTILNLVANKINLLTHDNGDPRFNLTDPDSLITEEEQLRILREAHPLVFGDILVEYLILLKNAFLNHVHNGTGNKPTDLVAEGQQLTVDTFVKKASDLEARMLSKNLKIN